jgi:hypothetical protein
MYTQKVYNNDTWFLLNTKFRQDIHLTILKVIPNHILLHSILIVVLKRSSGLLLFISYKL